MEINSIAANYFDDYRFTAPPGGAAEYGENNSQSFAEILKQAAAPQSGGTRALPSGTAVIDKTDKLYEQCMELETFIIKNLIGGMRKTIQKSGFIDEGFAGKMYEDMLYDEYAKEYTKNAGFGLAEQAYLELTGQRGMRLPL
jgi:flagellar protein FlgJ